MLKRGFTLIELMVAVAIIGLLGAILIPNVSTLVERARVSRTGAELRSISNSMDIYLADVGSYPPSVGDWGRPWGADVGLVERSAVHGNHLSSWNGPYLKQWPRKTAWGDVVGCAATGAYYVYCCPNWTNRDGIGSNDYWLHMNPWCVRYPWQSTIEIDKVVDDGMAGSGNMIEPWGPYYVLYYVGEGARNW